MAEPNWIADHDVHADISNLHSAATSAIERADDDELTDVPSQVREIDQVVEYLSGALESAYPLFTSRQTVDALRTPIQQVTSELNQFSGNGNQGHVTNAKNGLDNLVKLMAEIRPAPANDAPAILASLDPVNSRIQELEELAKQKLTELNTSHAAAVKQLEELQGQIEAGQELVKSSVNEVETKKNEVETAVSTKATELQGQTEARLSEFNAEAEERLQAQESAFEKVLNKRDLSAVNILKKLEELQKDATDIVGVIARTGMSAGYQQDANDQQEAADKWRVYTIAFGLAAVAVLIWSVWVGSDLTMEQLIGRILLSAAFGGLATYAGAQAQSHRKKARRSRNLELALMSLGPYLESLPEGNDKNKLLAAFAYVFFGNLESGDDGLSSPILTNQARELMKEIAEESDG